MSGQIEFLNKNWYRKYPLKATSNYTASDGTQLPLALFSGCKFVTEKNYSDLYIRKILVNFPFINITVSRKVGSTNFIDVGSGGGTITADNQSFALVVIENNISGFIITGKKETIKELNGSYTLDYTNGKIENSLITCFNKPAVTSIKKGSKSASGHVTLLLDNITSSLSGENLSLGVTNIKNVAVHGLESSQSATCKHNLIYAINNVLPDNDGNIDIYGIYPVDVSVNTYGVRITVPDLDFVDLCGNVNKNIPPLVEEETFGAYNACGVQQNWNAGSIPNAVIPEWHNWPQYSPHFPLPVCTTSTTSTSTSSTTTSTSTTSTSTSTTSTTTSSTTTQAPHNVLIPRLQWSWPTNDLDAHLQTPEIPNGSGNIWHVHWEGSGYTAQAPYANLNIDNRTGPGDEKIAIINPTTYSGIYRYYVHNYTTVGTVINATGAFVRLYSNNTPGSPFTLTSLVPLPAGPGVTEGSFVIVCTGNGDYWHVFNLNPALISPSNPWGIEIINTVSDTPPGYTISGEGISNPGPIL